MDFNKNLTFLQSKMSTAKIARLLGISTGLISLWKTQRRTPSQTMQTGVSLLTRYIKERGIPNERELIGSKFAIPLGINKKTMSKELGVTLTTIYSWCNGKDTRQARALLTLWQALNEEIADPTTLPWWITKTPHDAGQYAAAKRKKVGLSQEQLARKLGISQSIVSDYERGKRKFTKYSARNFEKGIGKEFFE